MFSGFLQVLDISPPWKCIVFTAIGSVMNIKEEKTKEREPKMTNNEVKVK